MEFLAHYFQITLDYLVLLIDKVGYFGIFIGMFFESTLVPIPSEAIMIPVGISAAYGHFNIYLAILVGIIGNVCGAIFSYYLAIYFGRPILFKVGKYFFIKEQAIVKIENYFQNHGSISIFIGRMIPGVRHYISISAGIAKMNFRKFYLYTTAGSALWVSILTYLGFLIGENKDLIKEYLHIAIFICVAISALACAAYMITHKIKNIQAKELCRNNLNNSR